MPSSRYCRGCGKRRETELHYPGWWTCSHCGVTWALEPKHSDMPRQPPAPSRAEADAAWERAMRELGRKASDHEDSEVRSRATESHSMLTRMRASWVAANRPSPIPIDRGRQAVELAKVCELPQAYRERLAKGREAASQAMRAVHGADSSQARYLVLSGDVDTGKTHALCWALWWRILTAAGTDRPTQPGLYVDARGWARAPMWGDEAVAYRRKLTRASLLVLDELGGEVTDNSGRWTQDLEHVLNARLNDPESMTYVSTRLTAQQIESRYGESVLKRLGGGSAVVELQGRWDRVAKTG